jgi:hypothetical protein
MKKILILLAICLFCGCKEKIAGQGGGKSIVTIRVKDLPVKVEVADSRRERSVGLSGIKQLKNYSGMLFVFPEEGKHTFWMKNCLLDLDIAFVDSSGSILKILTMKKQPQNIPDFLLKTYEPGTDRVKYALEMNSGWFNENSVKEGDKLKLPLLEKPAD